MEKWRESVDNAVEKMGKTLWKTVENRGEGRREWKKTKFSEGFEKVFHRFVREKDINFVILHQISKLWIKRLYG